MALRGSCLVLSGGSLMIKVRLASFALAVFALSCVGSVAMADCSGNSCGGRQGIFAKLHAAKVAGCHGAKAGCNGGGLFARLHAKKAASSCSAPAPTCAPAPAPSCGCAAPAAAPSCGCAAPAADYGYAAPAAASDCGCGASMTETMSSYVAAPASSGCSSCGTTLDAGSVSTSSVVPPAPVAPVAAPAAVSDKI